MSEVKSVGLGLSRAVLVLAGCGVMLVGAYLVSRGAESMTAVFYYGAWRKVYYAQTIVVGGFVVWTGVALMTGRHWAWVAAVAALGGHLAYVSVFSLVQIVGSFALSGMFSSDIPLPSGSEMVRSIGLLLVQGLCFLMLIRKTTRDAVALWDRGRSWTLGSPEPVTCFSVFAWGVAYCGLYLLVFGTRDSVFSNTLMGGLLFAKAGLLVLLVPAAWGLYRLRRWALVSMAVLLPAVICMSFGWWLWSVLLFTGVGWDSLFQVGSGWSFKDNPELVSQLFGPFVLSGIVLMYLAWLRKYFAPVRKQ